jgi:diguanylate cyclase (GGDEF)-like protein
MIDIDHFKGFNDEHGHPKGNVALKTVARTIVSSLRQTDTVARYGGEEFAVILPGCDQEAVLKVAEKIRRSSQRPLSAWVRASRRPTSRSASARRGRTEGRRRSEPARTGG